MQIWQIHRAKTSLSTVVKLAESRGPQAITVNGRSVAVVISKAMFDRLSGQRTSLLEFMQASPLSKLPDHFEFQRDNNPDRTVLL